MTSPISRPKKTRISDETFGLLFLFSLLFMSSDASKGEFCAKAIAAPTNHRHLHRPNHPHPPNRAYPRRIRYRDAKPAAYYHRDPIPGDKAQQTKAAYYPLSEPMLLPKHVKRPMLQPPPLSPRKPLKLNRPHIPTQFSQHLRPHHFL